MIILLMVIYTAVVQLIIKLQSIFFLMPRDLLSHVFVEKAPTKKNFKNNNLWM